MKKKLLSVMLVGAMAMSMLVGCGQTEVKEETQTSKVEESKTEESKAEEVEESEVEEVKDYTGEVLRIAWWGGDMRNEQTQDYIDEFVKNYPGLEVQVEYAGFGDYFNRLNTQAAGKELPDVMAMDAAKYYSYASNGLLLDLSSYIADGSLDMTNVDDAFVELGRVCDGLYGVACGVNGGCTLYNPAILEEAGCELSMQPTMSEIYEVAKTVKEKTGARIYIPTYENIYRSLGDDNYVDGEAALGMTEETFLKYEEWIMDLKEADLLVTDTNCKEMTNDGRLAKGEMWLMGAFSNHLATYYNSTGVVFDLVGEIVADDAVNPNPTYIKPAMLWSVAADTKLPEVAAAFLDFYVNEKVVYAIAGTDRGMPISSEMREVLASRADEVDAKSYAYVDWLGSHSSPIMYYVPESGPEASSILNEVRVQILEGALTRDKLEATVHEEYEKAAKMIAE